MALDVLFRKDLMVKSRKPSCKNFRAFFQNMLLSLHGMGSWYWEIPKTDILSGVSKRN